MSDDALARELALLRACWAFFDAVRVRVSAELQRGPRGGGRDRDHIVHHTLATEQDWAKKLGVFTPQDAILTDAGLNAHRDADCTAMRALHAQSKVAAPLPDSAHRVSHARSHLGNGRQGSECQTSVRASAPSACITVACVGTRRLRSHSNGDVISAYRIGAAVFCRYAYRSLAYAVCRPSMLSLHELLVVCPLERVTYRRSPSSSAYRRKSRLACNCSD